MTEKIKFKKYKRKIINTLAFLIQYSFENKNAFSSDVIIQHNMWFTLNYL